jgi:hypothetical protein
MTEKRILAAHAVPAAAERAHDLFGSATFTPIATAIASNEDCAGCESVEV